MKKVYNSIYIFIFGMFVFCTKILAVSEAQPAASGNTSSGVGGGGSCSSVLGGLTDDITEIFHIIGYVALAIGVILGMLDFFKVLVGGDKSELKSVGIKFVKRLLAIALLFILPALVDWLLDISGIQHGGTCIN